MTKFFLDTEFIQDKTNYSLHLISLGIVCENGQEYYAINRECPFWKANDWVLKNFLTPIGLTREGFNQNLSNPSVSSNYKNSFLHSKYRKVLKEELIKFISENSSDNPEFWGWMKDFDWVVLSNIFGTMDDLPNGYPFCAYELKQEYDRINKYYRCCNGFDLILPKPKNEHHALYDARWARDVYYCILSYEYFR